MANPVISIEDLKGWLASPWGWHIVWVPCLTVVIVVALFGSALDVHLWQPNAQRLCFYLSEQREEVNLSGFFVQFSNFWSNFAYLAAGLLIFFRNGSFIGFGTGLAFTALAVMSGYYHGSLTETGQTMDIAGIYMVLLALIFHGIVESFDLETSSDRIRNWFWFLLLFGLFMGFTKGDIPWHGSDIASAWLGGIIAILMVFGYIHHIRKYKLGGKWQREVLAPGIFAIVAFGIAALFKFGDRTDVTEIWADCNVVKPALPQGLVSTAPAQIQHCVYDACMIGKGSFFVWDDNSWAFGKNSVLQGHALWHVFSAFALLLIFEYFTSLRNKSGSIRPWR